MLTNIAIVLLVLWVLGFFTAYTFGGAIHVLLVIAVIILLVRIVKGKPVV